MTKEIKNRILKQLNFLKSIGYDYHDNIDLSMNQAPNNQLPNSFEDLKNITKNCFLCELSKSRKNVLFGQGDQNAKLMFIFDEPTATEDEMNSFFVGKNGEQLAKMIENVLPLKKEDVYITPLVKCRSNNGANISHYESCSAYLHKQIDILNPKLIVTLGEKTYQYLLNDFDSSFSQIRGNLLKFKEYSILPMHSASFLIRNPSSKKEAFSDLLKIKSILELN